MQQSAPQPAVGPEMTRLNFNSSKRRVVLALEARGFECFISNERTIISDFGNLPVGPAPEGGWGPQGPPAPLPVTTGDVRNMMIRRTYKKDHHKKDDLFVVPQVELILIQKQLWAEVTGIIFEKGCVSESVKGDLEREGIKAPFQIWSRLFTLYSGGGYNGARNVNLLEDFEHDHDSYTFDVAHVDERGALLAYLTEKTRLYDLLIPIGTFITPQRSQMKLLRGLCTVDFISAITDGIKHMIPHPYERICSSLKEEVTAAGDYGLNLFDLTQRLKDVERKHLRKLGESAADLRVSTTAPATVSPATPAINTHTCDNPAHANVNFTVREDNSRGRGGKGGQNGWNGWNGRGRGGRGKGRGGKGGRRGRGGRGGKGGSENGEDIEEDDEYTGKFTETRSCFNCGGLGHMSDVCPSK
jgi:hypothetical protein